MPVNSSQAAMLNDSRKSPRGIGSLSRPLGETENVIEMFPQNHDFIRSKAYSAVHYAGV